MRLSCPALKGKYLQIPGPSEFLQVTFTIKAAIKALHENTNAGQQHHQRQIHLARRGARHQKVHQIFPCLPASQNQQTQACQTRKLPYQEDSFQMVHIDLVGPLPESEGFKYILTAIDWAGLPLPNSIAPQIHRSNEGVETVRRQLDCNFWCTYFVTF